MKRKINAYLTRPSDRSKWRLCLHIGSNRVTLTLEESLKLNEKVAWSLGRMVLKENEP